MYSEEKAIAQEFLNKNKNNPIVSVMVKEVAAMVGVSHSDRWSVVYDTIYENFDRSDVPGAAITGLTYLIEEKGEALV